MRGRRMAPTRWSLTRFALLAAAIALAVPSISKGALPAAGVIEGGTASAGKLGSGCSGWVLGDLHFVGRMPAGAKTYTVTHGSGFSCDAAGTRDAVLFLHGETPSASFDWTCRQAGPIPVGTATVPGVDLDNPLSDAWEQHVRGTHQSLDRIYDRNGLATNGLGYNGLAVFDGSCETAQLPGSFSIHVRLILGQDRYPAEADLTQVAVLGGVYWVTGQTVT